MSCVYRSNLQNNLFSLSFMLKIMGYVPVILGDSIILKKWGPVILERWDSVVFFFKKEGSDKFREGGVR